MARGSLGFQQPAVTTYVNDVPTTVYGASMPTYDLANVQVLKGPQGTLFGRNSEAGAILTNTRAPTYDLNGYAWCSCGNYSWMKGEAALNIPMIDGEAGCQACRQHQSARRLSEESQLPGP